MANKKSALKQIKKNNFKRKKNKYYSKSTRTIIKKFQLELDKKKKLKEIPKISSFIDQLVKRKIIHKNKSNRLKKKLFK
ncbi:30S ribosomal protein S20 [Candidatus Karelsulcia muelleri]|uniref:Small ribosomal subunit protein bS20 n=1 Tax=Candidatus Karelsulcia muelleri PSPU TaxID=1189303 RepID=A0AAD1AZD8_9FLAO|nr:30S ribosomal protein S20 [Candidatus Karelsulcia muelleri]NJJ98714.1 30S ribosomal protein S20 [Candidatus Karelsulcia muelleri]BAO66367.1 30S ribosomal protein S20 [Candidatus Karelsulcia muelleri PSPU]